jgi:UDPglucose--hexose-1-phosphate uridylyltransferase
MDLRLDPITGEPILFATKRAARPHFGAGKPVHPAIDKARVKVPKKIDPFAPGNEETTGKELWVAGPEDRLPNTPGWQVRVIPNKFPITDDHEVVILSPDANKDLDRMSRKQVERIVQAYLERTKVHEPKGNVLVFCNHGPQAGASIAHPHAQIIVFPAVPPTTQSEVDAVGHYYKKHGNCLYCHILEIELKFKKRVVWQNEEFVLLCPEGSGWPYELLLLPRTHQPSFGSLKPAQATALAQSLQVMVSLYNTALKQPPYNYWIHSVKGHFFHWHVEMVPRTKTLAGVELGGGLMVNDRATPEDAAAQFRAALASIK